jgi:uncharacterized protein
VRGGDATIFAMVDRRIMRQPAHRGDVRDSAAVQIPHAEIASFCRANQIGRLSFFGSVTRDDFREDSDVDILVEFQPGARIGYLAMARMAQELSDMLGRPVDLRTPAELHSSFRDRVIAEALTEYVAA